MKRSPLLFLAAVVVPGLVSSCSTTSDPPPSLSGEALMDPNSCTTCHKDHYTDWSGSMHAYASDDPVFLAMNKRGQRETNGALGTFCVNCHAPMAVQTGATKDGLNLAGMPPSMKGVTCYFCHSVDAVNGTHNNPLHLATDGVLRGEYTDPVKNTAHNAGYSKLHDRDQSDSASLCGSCHDIATGHGVNIERTFSEWQTSVFSHIPGPSGNGIGVTCSQCHMDESKTLQPIAQAPNVFARRTHSHSWPGVEVAVTPGFPGVDVQKAKIQAFLNTTLLTSVCVMPLGPNASALRVIVDDAGAGHSWPSGSSPDRRAWVELVAYKAGAVIYQSGVVPDGGDVTKLVDKDLWLLRDCLFDDQNKQVSMFWQASSFESNTLPAQFTFDSLNPDYYKTHVVQNYPRDATLLSAVPDRVTMRVRLRPIGIDLLDDLVTSGDLDPAVRDQLNALPAYTVSNKTNDAYVEWTPAAALAQGPTSTFTDPTGSQVTCVTSTHLNSAATRYPAVNHVKCGP